MATANRGAPQPVVPCGRSQGHARVAVCRSCDCAAQCGALHTATGTGTVRGVQTPGWNRLDRVLLPLVPLDYVTDRHAFGRGNARFTVPDGGTSLALRVARRQHLLVADWLQHRSPATGRIAEVYGISKQTWSRITLGERWAGQVGLEALLDAFETRRS